ncbi:MAG: flagellar motor switch protein FliG [Rickettsiaceae bacterium]
MKDYIKMNEKSIDTLTGAQRVAIVLLTMSKDNASKIFSMMSEEEIKEVSYVMSSLGKVDLKIVDDIMTQLNDELNDKVAFMGNIYNTEQLLKEFLDDDLVQAVMEDIKGPHGKNTWEKLNNVNDDVLSSYIRNEYPQTSAVIFSQLPPAHAARILNQLPEGLAFDIITRILNIGNVKGNVLKSIEKVIRSEFISSFGKTSKLDSYEMVAEIFNSLARSNEGKFMSMLESEMPDAASKVKDLMFTFDDIVKIDSHGIQKILRNIDKSRVTLALKGSSEELQKVIFSSMSQRAAKIIQEDIVLMGSVRVKDVDSARTEIINVAKKLIQDGEIDLILDDQGEFVT